MLHTAASGKVVALQLLGFSRVPSPRPPSLAEHSVLEQLISTFLFQGINSSASQANENELVGTPRPPLKHNMQKRRNFRLGDARGNTFHRKKAGQLTPTHNTGAKADGLEGKPLLRPCYGWLEHCTESETSSSDALAVPGTNLRCPGRRHA